MKKTRAHVHIYGRVQGVCYRQWTLQQAAALGLKGWVRNLYKGSVEAVFEGDEPAVDQMLELCKEGPVMARVTHVEVIKQLFIGDFKEFRIKSTF